MRLSCLLLVGSILLYTCTEPKLSNRVSIYSPYDTLGKYSYLITAHPRSLRTGREIAAPEISTGFFFRKGDSLFLVSAFHVFTDCDIYKRTLPDETPSAIEVWYWDKSGNYKSQNIPVTEISKQSCLSHDSVDASAIYVSQYFKDGEIFSVEKMVPVYEPSFDNVITGDKVVICGFGNIVKDTYDSIRDSKPLPVRISIDTGIEVAEAFRQQIVGNDMSYYNYFVKPPLTPGFSGSPAFLIRDRDTTGPRIQFIGIQSGTDSLETNSVIVKGHLAIKRTHLK